MVLKNRAFCLCVLVLLIASTFASSSFCFSVCDCSFSQSVVLVTGFEPFDSYSVNPSELIAESLNGSSLKDYSIIGIVLPVDFNESIAMVHHSIDVYDPVIVLSIGLSARSHCIKVEKCGINIKRLPLENGRLSFPRRIEPSGPLVRISPLHVGEIVHAMNAAAIPSQGSIFAGTYVCNAVLYEELGYIATHHLSTKAGFIHVPLLSSQDPQGMELERMIDAVKIAITSI